MRVERGMITIAAIALWGCGGGGDGAEDAGSGAGIGGDEASSSQRVDETGSARVTIGEATFEFEVECMSGTMGVQGPGTRSDGTPAYLVATFDPDEPESADVDVRVGTDQLSGPADEKWSAGDTYGNSAGVIWEVDGRSVRASAPFRDREYGGPAELPGVVEVTCPER